jgi:serine/threonine protein kinase
MYSSDLAAIGITDPAEQVTHMCVYIYMYTYVHISETDDLRVCLCVFACACVHVCAFTRICTLQLSSLLYLWTRMIMISSYMHTHTYTCSQAEILQFAVSSDADEDDFPGAVPRPQARAYETEAGTNQTLDHAHAGMHEKIQRAKAKKKEKKKQDENQLANHQARAHAAAGAHPAFTEQPQWLSEGHVEAQFTHTQPGAKQNIAGAGAGAGAVGGGQLDNRLNVLPGLKSSADVFGADTLDGCVLVDLDNPLTWGSFKNSYKGFVGQAPVSVLKYRNSENSMEVVEAACKEVGILRKLPKHPNINAYIGTIQPPGKGVCIIMELCTHGQLDLFLREHQAKIECKHRIAILSQICEGMQAVSSAGIIHRDLAAHNVLVYGVKPLLVKLIDFGLAIYRDPASAQAGAGNVTKESEQSGKRCLDGNLADVNSVRWAAIEVLDAPTPELAPWSEKTDVWAYGITAWQVFAHGEVPYTLAMPDEAVRLFVIRGRRLGAPIGCPPDVFAAVMADCWKAADERPTFSMVGKRMAELRVLHMQ